jgi:hypothetical protein
VEVARDGKPVGTAYVKLGVAMVEVFFLRELKWQGEKVCMAEAAVGGKPHLACAFRLRL